MTAAFPTIQDVARAAGVSTATVSRALSYPERVTESTRRRVVAAIDATGYAPNQTARNLRRRTTGSIVVLVPNIGNPFFSQILAGIEQAASAAGYTVLICDTEQHGRRDEGLRAWLRTNRADGWISLDGALSPSLFDEGEGRRATAIFACEWNDRTGLPSVRCDNAGGMALAVAHLIELGHRAIGHVMGPLENVLTLARFEGYRRGLQAAAIALRTDWLFAGDFSLNSGADAARRWAAMDDRPSAMVLASDAMACGFISELHRMGLSVPEAVSVVGFDDIDIAGRFIPALTTVHQPRIAIGIAAFETLAQGLRDPSQTGADENCRLLPVELIVRESTRRV